MKKVILNIGSGSLEEGYQSVLCEFLEADNSVRLAGKLPPAPELFSLQQRWQTLYTARNQDQALRIHLLDVEGVRYSKTDFEQCCQALTLQFNEWLSALGFLSIDRGLRTELRREDDIQIILETEDSLLRRLPWHLWQFFEDYPRAELAFGAQQWRSLPAAHSQSRPSQQPPSSTSSEVRILATLGNSHGLDVSADLAALNKLGDKDERVSVSVLNAPTLNELHESLWQPQGWDIFFFAGHSQTEGNTGIIDINPHERLTIAQMKHALRRAIAGGLKIAIFNSCDGLGLAQQICDLQIPYVVVMREPIPDAAAQQFLHYLLCAFAEGHPFHLALRQARQRLAGLENEIPCASWLPVIWQNPTAPALHWQDFFEHPLSSSASFTPTLQPKSQPKAQSSTASLPKSIWQRIGLKSFAASALVLGIRALSGLEPLELEAYDRMMRSRPSESVDERIVVVEITEDITSEYGYPLPDKPLNELIQKINAAEPTAVGLDLHRAKPTPGKAVTLVQDTQPQTIQPPAIQTQADDYSQLLQQVEDNPNLFLVCFYNSADTNYAAPARLSEEIRLYQVGFSDIPIDRFTQLIGSPRGDLTLQGSNARMGESVRRQWLSYDPALSPPSQNCDTPYSLSFQLAFQYLDVAGITPLDVSANENWQFGEVEFESINRRIGGYQQLSAHSGQILLNYRANQPGDKVTYDQIMSDTFDANQLSGKVVLIGYTAPVSKDYFETPYGPMAGLWVHAHMVSQMMSAVLDDRPLIHGLPQTGQWQWGDGLWVLAWALAGGYAGARINRQPRWIWSLILGGLALYGVSWLALLSGLWLPLVPSSGAALASSLWLRWNRQSPQRLQSSSQ